MKRYEERIKLARDLYEQLMESKLYNFKELIPSMLPKSAGVYVIWVKQVEKVLYVGRTRNIQQRLYTNHLMGNKSSARLKKYLVEDNEKYPQITNYAEAKTYLKDNCCFQFIIEYDNNLRGHIEGLFGFLTDAQYIESEH
ncbi:MAG: GIY-YIG nuclease family protein [Lachnospiraceae bacterium]|nr:GIY-YIG nuclease family protein [Lachnospiraceae bacterium]